MRGEVAKKTQEEIWETMAKDQMLVGYRFHPTDEELISFFLKNKMMGNESLVGRIMEVDFCKWEPWELPKMSVIKSDDPEWFFFCSRDSTHSKAKNGRRRNRTTGTGYWKSTGVDRKIKARLTREVIGTKKTLVFYKGRVPKGERTSWVMHEYNPIAKFPHQRMFVLCRLKKKPDENDDLWNFHESKPNIVVASDTQNLAAEDTAPEVEGREDFLSHPTLQTSDYDFSAELPPLPSSNGFGDGLDGLQAQMGAFETDYKSEFENLLETFNWESFQECLSVTLGNQVSSEVPPCSLSEISI